MVTKSEECFPWRKRILSGRGKRAPSGVLGLFSIMIGAVVT